jgi:hypothetical protein
MTENLSRKGTFFIHHSSGISLPLGETTLGEACMTAGEKLKSDPGIQLTEKGKGEVENWKNTVKLLSIAKSVHIKRADDI